MFSKISKLTAQDDLDAFDSGQPDLDDWLKRFALVNQKAGMSTVFVTSSEKRVVGYYALATGGAERAEAPDRILRGTPAHPVPVILLTRLAVHSAVQGKGLGRALLGNALVRVANAADEIGVRALLVHAKDERAKAFYMRQAEFEPSPTDPLHLYLLMKDLRKNLPAQ
ncbi:N-acetyltransferase [Actinomadura sp. GC306]|uniref:GNAT family N-acetyltransferase n=1 Tax=Actinomadura sp. GC306 TaxID=2530367 RepID=UPI001047A481|nr:GNAT family N-acetyltransferase [Actinomadura sp. GC306]TDC67835.1 N-acetyltransferase [Actinomadura sp. GC306]